MANDSRRHAGKLAANAWRISKRKDAYHILLKQIYEKTQRLWMCPFCDTHERTKSGELYHRSGCLMNSLLRIMVADDDTIAQFLIDLQDSTREDRAWQDEGD